MIFHALRRLRTHSTPFDSFETYDCEVCGKDVAVNVVSTSRPLPGSVSWPEDKETPEEEGGYCDALGAATCGACYVEETAPSVTVHLGVEDMADLAYIIRSRGASDLRHKLEAAYVKLEKMK
jgi:hypothetical protein